MRFRPKPLKNDIKFECKFCIDCCRGRFIYLTLYDLKRIIEHGHDPQDFILFTAENGKIGLFWLTENGIWAVYFMTQRQANAKSMTTIH